MTKDRDWQWPWEKDPDWVQDPAGNNSRGGPAASGDETDKSINASSVDSRGPATKPPQYTIESVGIIVPDEGLKEGQPYRFKGRVRRLKGEAPSGARISVQAVYRYKKEDQLCGNPLTVDINKDTLDFDGGFDDLYEPNAYHLDKEKPAGAKYQLQLKVRGGCIDKDTLSPAVDLPAEGQRPS